MNRTGSKVMMFLVFTENNKNKGPFSSKKVIFSTKIVLALGIRSNKEVPRQSSKIWTLSTVTKNDLHSGRLLQLCYFVR